MKERPCWLYLLREGRTNLYKIGVTGARPESRLRACQTGNPTKLYLCFAWRFSSKGMALDVEQAVIREAKNDGNYKSGEWFSSPSKSEYLEESEMAVALIIARTAWNRWGSGVIDEVIGHEPFWTDPAQFNVDHKAWRYDHHCEQARRGVREEAL